jgi:hypothetical protein
MLAAVLLILLVILVVVALGGLPAWGWHHMGYGPSGIVGIIILLLVLYLLFGRHL